MNLEFPKLTPNEIEVRVQSVAEHKGCSLLLYKTARVDANMLDNVVGAMNWQKKYYEAKGQLFCSIGIFNQERNEWVWKDDTGSQGTIEEEKSLASDSMKRAGFQWGIGRELYTSPFIWYKDETITKESAKRLHFAVQKIGYDTDKNINELVIVDDKGIVAFSMGKTQKPQATQVVAEKTQQKPQNTIGVNGIYNGMTHEELVIACQTSYNLLDNDKKERWDNYFAQKGWGTDFNEMPNEALGVILKGFARSK